MNEQNFKFDDAGMRRLQAAIDSGHFVRLGIFGGMHKEPAEKKAGGGRKVGKKSSGNTNAEIGFLMEFGRPKTGNMPRIPARSFIRMPLLNHINDIGKECQAKFEEQIKDGDAEKFFKYMGTRAIAYIKQAFADSGPGWEPNTQYTIEKKGSATPLIDTGQLRNAVAFQVI